MCQIATIQSSDYNETIRMSPHDGTIATTQQQQQAMDERAYAADLTANTKYFVDIYTAALHLR